MCPWVCIDTFTSKSNQRMRNLLCSVTSYIVQGPHLCGNYLSLLPPHSSIKCSSKISRSRESKLQKEKQETNFSISNGKQFNLLNIYIYIASLLTPWHTYFRPSMQKQQRYSFLLNSCTQTHPIYQLQQTCSCNHLH